MSWQAGHGHPTLSAPDPSPIHTNVVPSTRYWVGVTIPPPSRTSMISPTGPGRSTSHNVVQEQSVVQPQPLIQVPPQFCGHQVWPYSGTNEGVTPRQACLQGRTVTGQPPTR